MSQTDNVVLLPRARELRTLQEWEAELERIRGVQKQLADITVEVNRELAKAERMIAERKAELTK